MKIIHISSLPLMRGYFAINLCGVVFSRSRLNEREKRHEYIHTLQQREMLFVGFFLWYIVEWAVKLIVYRDKDTAYRNISFEREAYHNEGDEKYPTTRRHYAWWEYL
ncbi:MAG: hypothetical protein IJV10_05650 [Prevotella sp.]|nr:hypothetical protein [Prevotella sp.]MBR1839814.1 hypothetical protein [Prevotella sp.]